MSALEVFTSQFLKKQRAAGLSLFTLVSNEEIQRGSESQKM
jgi:hypothetical protein